MIGTTENEKSHLNGGTYEFAKHLQEHHVGET